MCAMQCRTDIALEMLADESGGGIEHTSEKSGFLKIDRVKILGGEGEKATGKPRGNYITVTMPPLSDGIPESDEGVKILAGEIKKLIPETGTVLVTGLGNTAITPDALGPLAAKGILATRHISGEFERIAGLEKLRSVAVIAPGVLGQTGIEVSEILKSLTEKIKPSAIIAIDALAAMSLSRLGCTVQISDAGISPGAGVGNNRPGLNRSTLGVPVIAVGVPTVVDAEAVIIDTAVRAGADDEALSLLKSKASPRGEPMIVTPREIDLIIKRAARLIALSVNLAMHPDYDPKELADAV